MADEQIVKTGLVTEDGKRVVITSDSLDAATPLGKGAVKQGAREVCVTEQNSKYEEVEGVYYPDFSKRYNDAIKSRRAAGQTQNTEFVVILDFNAENVDHDAAQDQRIFHAGDTVTLQMSGKYIPEKEGYIFKGWALTPDASVPTYPYDESDPQDYTLTFVDDDITLYGIWEENIVRHTVTYSLGNYGQGSVPAAQTVEEGETVYLSFSPAPTVNDGSGRVFVGWSTTDEMANYMMATYRQNGTSSIILYQDVTLYPVFCAERTLTYALGNDGTGSVPQGGTYYNGQQVMLSFSPEPTCVSDPTKTFLGWNTSDEQSTATYPKGGMMPFLIMSDMTLYPAFGVVQTYTLTYALGDYATGSVPAPTTGNPSPMVPNMIIYQLSYTPEPTCTRAGNWEFIGWNTSDGQTTATYQKDVMYTAQSSGSMTLYPAFQEVQAGDSIEVVNNSSSNITITRGGVNYDSVSAGATKSITIEPNMGGYEFSVSSVSATFTGTYRGTSYTNVELPYDVKNSAIPAPDHTSSWSVQSGDGGTLTVED